MANLPNTWTEPQTDMMREHFHAGLSCRQSARLINEAHGTRYTRNAIVGRRHRLGLKLPAMTYKIAVTTHSPAADCLKRAVQTAVLKVKAAPKPKPVCTHAANKSAMEARQAEPAPDPAGLKPQVFDVLDLRPHHCRWPYGEPGTDGFGFCGAHKHGEGAYCRSHHQVAYTDRLGSGRLMDKGEAFIRGLRRYA